MRVSAAAPPADSRAGVWIAVATFTLWGLYPFYFKAVGAVPPLLIVAHRVVWSLALLLAVLGAQGRLAELAAALGDRHRLSRLLVTTGLIAVNWSCYVITVTSGHVLEASLGYFLGPLCSVALGVLVLKERLTRVQLAAVLLAAAAVLNYVLQLGVVPVMAILLGTTFSLYGLVRKRLPVAPAVGLCAECLLGLPLAALVMAHAALRTGTVGLSAGDLPTTLLLLAAGIATAAPMLLFNIGAKKVGLVTLGLAQYIAPSLLFLESAFVFGEPVDRWRLATFALIWLALALYTGDGLRRARKAGMRPA